jgi:alpha-2-macroglobulin
MAIEPFFPRMHPRVFGYRRPLFISVLALLLFLAGTAGFSRRSDLSDGARLLLTGVELSAGSTFELRLDQPVVSVDQVGTRAAVSPLHVDPPLPGEFTWTSRRSGLFVPHRPLDLGTPYRFSLRPGLKNADGAAVRARLIRTFQTPPITLEIARADYWENANASPWPRFQVSANARLLPEELQRRAHFRNGHARIPAEVVVLTNGVVTYGRGDSLVPWFSSFPLDRASQRGVGAHPTVGSPLFLVLPVRPLPAGNGWTLEVSAGLSSPETSTRTQEAIVAEIGHVAPFGTTDIRPSNPRSEQRRLAIQLNRRVPASLTNDPPERWIQCQPTVTNLHWVIPMAASHLEVAGDFQLRTPYRTTLRKGLPAETGETLTDDTTRTVEFQPIPSSVWFSSYDTSQLADGRRELELLAINQSSTRLRLKQLDAHTLIHTLRAYERYKGWHGGERDAIQPDRLDYAGVAGITVLDTNLVTHAGEDEALRLNLNWNSLIGSGRVGAYFVQADVPRPPTTNDNRSKVEGPQAIVQLTDLGLEVKSGRDWHTVLVFSQRTARPLPGVTVSLRSDENEILESGTTDQQGQLRLRRHVEPVKLGNRFSTGEPLPLESTAEESGKADPRSPREAWMLAETGADLHAIRLGEGRVNLWRYDLPRQGSVESPDRLFAFSDREAYRPGETFHWKLLARHWTDDAWIYPTNSRLQLELMDPRGVSLCRTNLSLVKGSADWSWVFSPGGPRGSYIVRMNLGTAREQQSVEVRDFRPPAFEVILSAPTDSGPDTRISIPVAAKYLFGTPLQRASVHWSFQSDAIEFRPKAWNAFIYGNSGLDWPLRRGSGTDAPSQNHSLNGTTELSTAHPVVLEPDFQRPPGTWSPSSITVQAEVTDLNQQTVTRTVQFERHASDFYLGFRWKDGEENLLPTHQPLKFELVATRWNGSPVNEPRAVSVQLQRVEWRTLRVVGAGRTIDYRTEHDLREVTNQWVRTEPVHSMGDRWVVGESPTATPLQFPPLNEPGHYLATFHCEDDGKHPVETRVSFYVSGDGRVAWNEQNGSRLTLIPDKPAYHPGETARLLIEAPFEGTVWVTTERENVRSSFSLETTGNAPSLEIPIGLHDAPNVVVSVTLIRGHGKSPREFPMPEWRVGYVSLPVVDESSRLVVQVAPDRDRHAPGDLVTVTATVQDTHGFPVADADLTLYAVDESFLLMTGTGLPDPTASFGRPRSCEVETGLSLPDLISENSELRGFINKGAAGGGGGRWNKTRRDFLPCPYWNGGLMSDAGGKVRVTFTTPDSLTRFRIVAVATHGPARFGSGGGSFEVQKELMIEPSLPSVVHVGDRLMARAVVFNRTQEQLPLEVSVRLGTNGLASTQAATTNSLTLAAGASAPVEFPVEFNAVGTDRWLWSVVASDDRARPDSVEGAVTVLDAETELRDVQHLRLARGPTNLFSSLSPEVLQGTGTVRVRISASPLAFLAEGAGQLLHYPYGCVEQTGSSLIPWLALRDLPGLRPEEFRDPTNVMVVLTSGVQRLLSMQTPSGGLGYWPGDREPQAWGSAYGALILALASEAGVAIPAQAQKRLNDWLGAQWRKSTVTNTPDWSERCLTACALAFARQPDRSLNQNLVEHAEQLALEDRALAAMALVRSPGSADQALSLLTMAPRKSTGYGLFGNQSRNLAIQLLGWLSASNGAPQVQLLADQLLASQRRGHWQTTQGNAWALWALSEYSRRPEGRTEVRGDWQFAGISAAFETTSSKVVTEITKEFGPGTPAVDLMLHQREGPPAFVEISATGHRIRPSNVPHPPIDHGFSIRRTYARLDDENRPQSLRGLRVGDRVLVTLVITASDPSAWIAIEDPLPAVFESVQGVFKTQQTTGAPVSNHWFSDFQEFRRDRTWFFRNELEDGRHTIQYLARVRCAGTAVAAPAKVEAMYEPERYGLSGGETIEVIQKDE